MIRVLSLDGHEIFHVGVKSILSSEDSIEFLGGLTSVEEACVKVDPHLPDIILFNPTNLDNPDWLRCTKHLTLHFLKARLIAILHTCEEVKRNPLQFKNVFGLISKKEIHQKLGEAVTKVNSGEEWISPGLISKIFTAEQKVDLTLREINLLTLIAQGKSNKEIGKALHISERTVRDDAKRIQNKLGVEKRIATVVWAVQSGLIPRNDSFL